MRRGLSYVRKIVWVAETTLFRTYFLTAALLLLIAGRSHAQFYQPWHRPIEAEYQQLRSPHFRIIYQHGLLEQAEEAGRVLEESLPELRAFVGLRRPFKLPVVLNRFTDLSNGFVTSAPFRQEMEAFRIRGHALSPRFSSWIETVAPHELAHAVHAESGGGFGVGWVLRLIGPDLARSLNLSGPRGINEGLAVWYESRIRPDAGRLHHALFRMEIRAAMLSDEPWNLTQMLEDPAYTRPFDRYYHGGGMLFEYMDGVEGDTEFFKRARDFYYRFPMLGYGPALWFATGSTPHAIGTKIQKHYRERARDFIQGLGPLTVPEIIASERGAVFRRPRWLSDSTLVVYARGYHRRPGFYRVHLGARRLEPISFQAISEDYQYHLTADSSAILFARYVLSPVEALRARSEIFQMDVETGGAHRLTRDARGFSPVPAPDGGIWFLRNVPGSSVWSVREADGSMATVQRPRGDVPLSIIPNPDGDEVAVIVNQGGRQYIARADFDHVDAPLQPWIEFPGSSIYDASWSRDGEYLAFSADPRDVVNVYVWERSSNRIYRMTNVPHGAFEASISPDGTKLAFVHYRHERYELAVMPFIPGEGTIVPQDSVRVDAPIVLLGRALTEAGSSSRTAALSLDVEDEYHALRSIRPRVGYPFLVYQIPSDEEGDTNLGLGVGAGIEWSDPLQYWTAHTSAFYQKGTAWGRLLVSSGKYLIRPSLELFREPSTVVARVQSRGGVDTVRIGRDERGLALGLRLPTVLSANVFQTTASFSITGELRRERLFDDEGRTLRPPDDRITLAPAVAANYRLQANPRDIVPNSGVSISAFSRLDLWSDRGNPQQYVQVRSTVYLPFFYRSSTGISLGAWLHAQNSGGIVDLTTFFPRGYEGDPAFLGEGVFSRLGVEITQPLWYIDNGILLLPIYVKALFAYGFAETLGAIESESRTVRRGVAGAGLGVQLRLWHRLDITLRLAPVYRFQTEDWRFTLR